MDKIKNSDINLNRQIDLLLNNYVINRRLKNELRKWLYIKQLDFDNNTEFLLSIYQDILGDSLQIKIDGNYDKYHTIRLVHQLNTHNRDYKQYIILENDHIQIKMEYGPVYPFRSPNKIYINGYDYITLLKCQARNLKQIGLEEKCLCCCSLTCSNNWAPSYNICNLLDEIEHNLSIKRGISDSIHCDVIKRKYLVDDISLMDYLF